MPLHAHEASAHEHAEFVPIPEYRLPFYESGAMASLQAVEAFLASLNPAQRTRVMFGLDARERAGWSNLPARFVKRAGISIGDLSDQQRGLLFDFLASSLGEDGYHRVSDAIAAEAFLSPDG